MIAFRPDENTVCVQCPCILSDSSGITVGPGASAEQRRQSVRPECHCPRTSGTTALPLSRPPPSLTPPSSLSDPRRVEPLSPWMTYTAPLTGAADVVSVNTCWLRAAAECVLLNHSGQQVKASLLQASGRLRSS